MNRKLTVTAEIEISGDLDGQLDGGGGQEKSQIFLVPHPLASGKAGGDQDVELTALPPGDNIELPGAITILARLPGKAILNEDALSRAFGVTPRTLRRMVTRFELPPPTRIAGRSCWIVGRVLSYLDEMAQKAEKEQKKVLARFEKHRP